VHRDPDRQLEPQPRRQLDRAGAGGHQDPRGADVGALQRDALPLRPQPAHRSGPDGVAEHRGGPGHVGLGVDRTAAGVEEPLSRPRAEERQRRPDAGAVEHLVRQAGRGQARGALRRSAHEQGALAPEQRDAEPLLGGPPRQAAAPRQLHALGRVGDVAEDPPRPAGLAGARPLPLDHDETGATVGRGQGGREADRPCPDHREVGDHPGGGSRPLGCHFASSASWRRRRSPSSSQARSGGP
jgi:hypothetical protein